MRTLPPSLSGKMTAAATLITLAAIVPLCLPTAARADNDTLSRYIYPLSPDTARGLVVTTDISDRPDAAAWAEKAKGIVSEWFPVVWQLMGTEGQTPPKELKIYFKQTLNVPAYAQGGSLYINGEWIQKHPDDFGMMIHELTHIIQNYHGQGERPGWLVEGIADYIRWWRYEPGADPTKINPLKNSYHDSYRITGMFLNWISNHYNKGIVPRLDKALRDGSYTDALFKDLTGKDLDTLWSEFAPKPAAIAEAGGSAAPTDTKAGMKTLPSGLQYQDLLVGTGKEAKAGMKATVHYTGTLTNGTKFDSTDDHDDKSFTFPLGAGQVIKGWDEGVAGMKVGGKRKLVIPPDLGYGKSGVGPIPPNATLIFTVELVDVN